jgi:hypothetical protein
MREYFRGLECGSGLVYCSGLAKPLFEASNAILILVCDGRDFTQPLKGSGLVYCSGLAKPLFETSNAILILLRDGRDFLSARRRCLFFFVLLVFDSG